MLSCRDGVGGDDGDEDNDVCRVDDDHHEIVGVVLMKIAAKNGTMPLINMQATIEVHVQVYKAPRLRSSKTPIRPHTARNTKRATR